MSRNCWVSLCATKKSASALSTSKEGRATSISCCKVCSLAPENLGTTLKCWVSFSLLGFSKNVWEYFKSIIFGEMQLKNVFAAISVTSWIAGTCGQYGRVCLWLTEWPPWQSNEKYLLALLRVRRSRTKCENRVCRNGKARKDGQRNRVGYDRRIVHLQCCAGISVVSRVQCRNRLPYSMLLAKC